MMCRALLMLLLLAGWSYVEAATHVNISIAQQPATNPADVSYVDGRAPAELRAGPAMMNEEERFERIQERSQPQPQPQQQQMGQQQQQMGQQQQQQQVGQQQQQQQSAQLSPRQGLGLQASSVAAKNARMPRRRNHSRRFHQQLQPQLQAPHNGQFRQRNQQLRQNQEFERYIQSYHSHGPTVETVYESSNPAPQRYTQTSSGVTSSASDDSAPQKVVAIGGSRSQQLRMFERQVAAPVSSSQGQSANVEVAAESKPIYEAPQASVAAAVHSSTSGVSSSSSASSGSASVPVPTGASHSADTVSSYDATSSYNPATSYNRPSYDPNVYNYDDGQDVDYHGQYPPEVEDGQGYDSQGYDDYSDQASSYPGGSGYLPPAPPRSYAPPQRPMVTKTIQIVQPALKAKKYEVRHPAIQKEFYDIEERVLIKPAGTLVVELDHPVAKIPKGETLLPLGHPHPAVAAAYSNNGQNYNTQSYNSNSNSNSNGNGNGNEYRPSYDSYDSPATSKDQQTTTVGSSVTTMPSYDQAPKDEYVEARLQQQKPQQAAGDVVDSRQTTSTSVSAVDGNGNPIKINTKHLTPNMITRAEPEQEYSRSIPPNEVNNYERPLQRSYQQRTSYNRQPYNNNDDYFAGEFLPNVNAANVDAKPARLEQAPVEQEQPRTQIIKHEHKIHLPPSQHNIYLGRSSQTPPKEQRITEVPAHVAEIKPYLRNHVGGTVVYAKAAVKPAVQRGYYAQSARQRNPLAEDLEYSAPYSQMRFSPENQSARLVEAPPKEVEVPKEKASQDTHIQIQIGDRNEGKQPMVVASTVTPDCDKGQQQQQQPSARLQQRQQQSQRLVEAPAAGDVSATKATPTPVQAQPQDVDVSLNGGAGHLKPNERVIAATAAPTDAAATSETFHKRRIVVNHPFQTVREVVEHEPITNYHQIQVNEHAHPALYHQAAYYQPPVQTHGNLVHFQSTSTHGNLYAPYG
ncbi:uncharacterized protein DDB_G0283357 [Drosophila miranda]|uniref:uncharacterized protein DDB_G0283357 n=1 Tax=Drosophila miranda TaxID=7229 RepID=UPI0007E85673|nr:uncharacterized protein DDB_G0283357 [Drosophila miranda]